MGATQLDFIAGSDYSVAGGSMARGVGTQRGKVDLSFGNLFLFCVFRSSAGAYSCFLLMSCRGVFCIAKGKNTRQGHPKLSNIPKEG